MSPAPTLACALEVEERAARKGGAPAVRVGVGARLPLPDERLVSFGLAGALVPGLSPGTLLTARRIVDAAGVVLWEGQHLEVPGAKSAVICSVGRLIDDSEERRALADRTGAVAVDMESGALAASGRLAGVVRAVVDGPERRVGRLAFGTKDDGSVEWHGVARSFICEPIRATRTSLAARRALGALERAASALSGGSR